MARPAVSFGGLLRRLRLDAGLTQEELAHAATLSARAVSDLERGINLTARKETARLLADALGLSGPDRTAFEAAARGGDAAGVLTAVTRSLPHDVGLFAGREAELAELTNAAGLSGALTIHAIDGMPGVGKTALAIHVSHVLEDRFPDRQLFIDLHAHTPGHDPTAPEDALAGLLTAVGIDVRYMPEDLEARAAVWRDKMAGQRALLVLDNAASSEQVTPLLPGSMDCLVLVTSRRHLGDLPGVAVHVSLDALPRDQAEAMFLGLAPRAAKDPAEAVHELVRLAGYLPLAISLLARVYARHPAWTLADLTGETKANLLTLAAEKNSVAAAFEVSYRHLVRGQQQFFRRLGLHPGTTIDAYAAAALTGIPLDEASWHLDDLHAEGLLTEAGYRRYGMHDLIRLYARDCGTADTAAERDQALERLLGYYQHSAALSQSRLARQSRTRPGAAVLGPPPTAFRDLPDRTQALAWARTERANLLACLDHVTRADRPVWVLSLTASIAALLRHDGPWTNAIALYSTAVQAAAQLGDWQGQADLLIDLGVVLNRTDDYPRAAQTLEAALRIYRDLGDRLGQANALNEMGIVRLLTGNYQGAAKDQESALVIYRDLGDELGQANALEMLGMGQSLTGDYPGAAQTLETALGIYRDLSDQLGQADALNKLGVVRRQAGDFPGAAKAQDAAMGLFCDVGNRQGQADALSSLGP